MTENPAALTPGRIREAALWFVIALIVMWRLVDPPLSFAHLLMSGTGGLGLWGGLTFAARRHAPKA